MRASCGASTAGKTTALGQKMFRLNRSEANALAKRFPAFPSKLHGSGKEAIKIWHNAESGAQDGLSDPFCDVQNTTDGATPPPGKPSAPVIAPDSPRVSRDLEFVDGETSKSRLSVLTTWRATFLVPGTKRSKKGLKGAVVRLQALSRRFSLAPHGVPKSE